MYTVFDKTLGERVYTSINPKAVANFMKSYANRENAEIRSKWMSI
jgi:hypothetical protein